MKLLIYHYSKSTDVLQHFRSNSNKGPKLEPFPGRFTTLFRSKFTSILLIESIK